jgi:hypothetical protein
MQQGVRSNSRRKTGDRKEPIARLSGVVVAAREADAG